MTMQASPGLVRAVNFLDRISLWSGRIVAWLIIPMVMSLVWEVVARYFFNAPTIWAYDMTYMLYGSFFMLGSAYTLLRGKHIRTDNFYGQWSPRRQGLVDTVCYLVFFFPPLIALLYVTWDYFWLSFMRGKGSLSSPWMPIIYPLKFTMPVTCILLLLQGVAEFLRSLHAAMTGEWLRAPSLTPSGWSPMSEEWIGIVSLALLFGAIFIGFPIAFTLMAIALGVGYLALGPIALHLMTIQFFAVMKETSLASVPFFLFMGFLLEQSGLMERLFRGIQQLLANVRGSLYLAVLITATIFAAATGIVGSSVTLLGVMAAPSMTRSGYDVRLSAGAITAGGTLGILIPPSVMLIVMGPVVGVPTTDLFAAAVFPGLVLSGLYIVYCLGRSYIDPSVGPPLREDERMASTAAVLKELLSVWCRSSSSSLQHLAYPCGIATPTDAGACGAFVVLMMTVVSRTISWQKLKNSVYATLEVSCMILLLVAASNYFGAVFSRLGSANMIAEGLLNLPLPPMVMLILILMVIFVLGWPLEWVPIVLIVVPILLPLVQKLGIDLIWFCTLVAVCLQTAWLSPPVALSAYFLKGVVPDWKLSDIYAGMMQFMVLQVIGLGLVMLFPQLALWLPAALRN